MAALPPVGAPTDPLNAPSLSAFATAIRAALDGSDVTVDTRLAAIELTPGPPGADGLPGPQGDPGPAGPPGTAYLNAQWDFNQTTTVSPNAGTMRMNATTYAAVTTLWVHESDRDGLSRIAGLDLAKPGDQIIMQSAQGRAVWQITSHADSGVYRTLVVTLIESSGTRPSAGSKTTLYFATVGTTAAVILSGTATPTGATGNLGDYYLDTDDHILYGPKVATGDFGSAESVFTIETPLSNSGALLTWGNKFQIAKAGRITGLRFFRNADTGSTSYTLKIWTDAGALLGTTTTSQSGSGWKTGYFGTPITIASAQTVVASVDMVSGGTMGNSSSGVVTLSTASLTLPPGYVYATSVGTFPTTVDAASRLFIDIYFEASATPWPVALKSVPPGGTTGQYLKKTSGVDYAAAWVT